MKQNDKEIMYLHPWCNRFFAVRDDWREFKLATLCCIFLCNLDPLDCPHCHMEKELSEEVEYKPIELEQ